MMTYEQIVREIENLFEALQDIFIAALIRFGPYIVASIPAIFTGTSVAATHGTPIGSVVGVGLEVTVLLSVYAASSLYDQKMMGKFWFMVWLFPFYFVGISLAILYPTATGLGLIAPILTIICYIAGMFIREVGKDRKRVEAEQAEGKQAAAEISKAELEHRHELERLALEQKHAEKMARIEAKKNSANAPQNTRNKPQNSRVPKVEWRKSAVNILRENPDISGAKLAEYLGASERTGQNILNELEQAGTIQRDNGGWKVNSNGSVGK